MNPYELRVNNLVHFTKENVDSEIGHHNLGILLSLPSSNDYEPIPLTEKWLLKFGFKQFDTNFDGGHHFHALIKGDLHFVSDFEDCSEVIVDGFDIAVKYVHQFQNLYFALTGEELVYEKV